VCACVYACVRARVCMCVRVRMHTVRCVDGIVVGGVSHAFFRGSNHLGCHTALLARQAATQHMTGVLVPFPSETLRHTILAGCLCAALMAQRGFTVDVFEVKEDLTSSTKML
jgi:hypothetical protein